MIFAIIEVLIGAFLLFNFARITYAPLLKSHGWFWVTLLIALAVANMLIHRFVLSSSINPPFFTAVIFVMTLAGLTPKEASAVQHWHKRGIYGVVLGTLLGWASYAQVVSA